MTNSNRCAIIKIQKDKELLKMIAWYWLIVAFILGLVLATIVREATENILSTICAGLAIPFVYVALFPITFWKNVVKPVSPLRFEQFQKLNIEGDRCFTIGKNLHLWHDKTTKHLYAKWFLIRVSEK